MFAYDAERRLTSVTDPLSNVTQYGYDFNGNRTSVTDPKGKVTIYAYDSLNRLLTTTDPLGHTTTNQYDALGRVTKSTDANGNTTPFAYDALGRLTQVTDANGGTAHYTYDPVGNRLTVVDPNNNTTTFTYDAANRLATSTNPLNKTYTYSYDAVGNRTQMIDANGATIGYSYDDNNRLSQIQYPDSTTVTFTYDANGNRTQMVDAVGTSNYVYDELNRLTSYTDAYGKTIGYEYDANGNRTALIYPDGKQVTYTYDAANRLSQVMDWASRVTTYTYDTADLLTCTINANGTTVSYSYDDAQRLTSLFNRKSDSSVISSYNYTLDNVGNRIGVTLVEPLAPAYVSGTTSYTYNTANQIATAGATTFTFDDNGNMCTKVTGGVTTTYTYDFQDRLTSASDSTTSAQYSYNGVGLRLSRIIDGITTRFVVNEAERLSQVLVETDSSGAISSYYVYGIGLLSKVLPNGSAYTYHFDPIGSTVSLTDSSEVQVNKYAYDFFGKLSNEQETAPNSFKYIGRLGLEDEENGLLFIRARYYAPQLGRFLSVDPQKNKDIDSQTINRYTYALNNPILLVDSNGEFAHIIAGAVFGGAFGITKTLVNDAITSVVEGDLKVSSFNTYIGNAVGGAASGAFIAGTGGTGLLYSGAASAIESAVSNATTQGLDLAFGYRMDFDTEKLLRETALGAGLGITAGAVSSLLPKPVGRPALLPLTQYFTGKNVTYYRNKLVIETVVELGIKGVLPFNTALGGRSIPFIPEIYNTQSPSLGTFKSSGSQLLEWHRSVGSRFEGNQNGFSN